MEQGSINIWIHAHVIPLSVQTTIKSHYEGVVALEEVMLSSQTAKEGSCTQGKDSRGRSNHYIHRATAASLQQGQGVGNVHLNKTDCLWGGSHRIAVRRLVRDHVHFLHA